MRSAALLTLVAWRLVVVAAARGPPSSDTDLEPLSNIELLIPLLVSEQGESYQRAQDDDDEPYSGIPADVFALDDDIRVLETAGPGPGRPADPRARPSGPWPRSLYLQQRADSGEQQQSPDGPRARAKRRDQLQRACERLARTAGDALLYLCEELLDLADPDGGPAPAPVPSAPAAHACPCCGANVAPQWLRRDLMPLGENSYMVQKYMNMQRKRPPPPWVTEP